MIIGMREGARDRVRDQRIERVVELVAPEALIGDLPLGEEREAAVVKGRQEVENVLERVDDRLLVVVGPCSVHDVDAALEYGERLTSWRRSWATTCWWRCASTSRSRARRPAGRA